MERKPTYAELIAAGVSPEEARAALAARTDEKSVLTVIHGELRRVPKKAAEMAREAEERRIGKVGYEPPVLLLPKARRIPPLEHRSLSDMGMSKCWSCGKEFDDNEFCDSCHTFKCPHCGTHYCSLPEEAKRALDAEMYTLGLWSPYTNPCRRKTRRK